MIIIKIDSRTNLSRNVIKKCLVTSIPQQSVSVRKRKTVLIVNGCNQNKTEYTKKENMSCHLYVTTEYEKDVIMHVCVLQEYICDV